MSDVIDGVDRRAAVVRDDAVQSLEVVATHAVPPLIRVLDLEVLYVVFGSQRQRKMTLDAEKYATSNMLS